MGGGQLSSGRERTYQNDDCTERDGGAKNRQGSRERLDVLHVRVCEIASVRDLSEIGQFMHKKPGAAECNLQNKHVCQSVFTDFSFVIADLAKFVAHGPFLSISCWYGWVFSDSSLQDVFCL